MKNYSMKLSRDQADSLKKILAHQIDNDLPDNMAESLIRDLLIRVFKKIRNRLEAFPRSGYSIILSSEEAKAFYLYFSEFWFEDDLIYERVLIEERMADINKLYA